MSLYGAIHVDSWLPHIELFIYDGRIESRGFISLLPSLQFRLVRDSVKDTKRKTKSKLTTFYHRFVQSTIFHTKFIYCDFDSSSSVPSIWLSDKFKIKILSFFLSFWIESVPKSNSICVPQTKTEKPKKKKFKIQNKNKCRVKRKIWPFHRWESIDFCPFLEYFVFTKQQQRWRWRWPSIY